MSKEKTFKILAIDGGGIKGLYSSTILEHFEEKYGGNISDYFDMICGTSTGGLIALALSLKIPAKDISDIYIKSGSKIFPKRSKFKGFYRQVFWKGKFSDVPLKRVLKELFGDKKIKETNNLLCIPSYSVTDSKTWIFKYDHKEGDLSRDNDTTYADVALATSAAPTYFPMAEIKNYNNRQFIDGGVWANNPSLVGLIEALTYFVGKDKEFQKLKILSISSLAKNGGELTGIKRERSFINWRNDLFETSLIGQSSFTDYFLSKIQELNEVSIDYLRIPSANIPCKQENVVQLDISTLQAIDIIRSKGNDMGEVYKKKEEIKEYFKYKKEYKI